MSESPVGYAEFVRLVLDALNAAGVPYLIGGAMATWAWSEPRSTLDLDLVVDIPIESVRLLSHELEQRRMLVPVDIILDAMVDDRGDLPLNIIHLDSGFKADLYLLRDNDELRQSAMQRRIQVNFGPPIGEVYIHSPEDLIIYKTWYFSLSGQTKHVRDIAGLLNALGDEIDFAYITHWVERRGLQTTWQKLRGYSA